MVQLLKNRKWWSGIFIVALIFLGVELITHSLNSLLKSQLPDLRFLPFQFNSTNNTTVPVQKPHCPDVANGMMNGRWKSRPLSIKEETEIDSFLESARTEHGMPKSMQREDGKCGTVTYKNLFWFRALCNPKGPTPCCFGEQCVAKSPDECRCAGCFDLRTLVHAEYSTWIPEDPRCEVKNFTASDACDLLHNTQLFMVGDSLMRQVYIAVLLILTNNDEDGAFRPDIPKDVIGRPKVTEEIHDRCKGMFMFTEKSCRPYVNYDSIVCNKSSYVSIREYYRLDDTRKFHNLAISLLHKKNTVLIVGIGYHDSFHIRVYEEYILPVVLMMKIHRAVWPRLIWSTNHKFGILKTPLRPDQDNTHVKIFNKFLSEHLREFNIPIFDTYNMTSGVMSQDGSHFGVGLNLMKAQMLLNFLQELKGKEPW